MKSKGQNRGMSNLLKEEGLSIFEALVALCLTTMVLLTHAQAIIQNHETFNRNRRNALAMQQAETLLESYWVKDLPTISTSDNLTENNYLYNGIRFNRTVTVTQNSNASVIVAVSVTSATSGLSGSASLSKEFTFLNKR